MSQQFLNLKMHKTQGKLRHYDNGSSELYQKFIDSLEDGQEVSFFMEITESNGTNNQLAKIHVVLRELANELGYTVLELKNEIKNRCGLVYGGKLKSFADCSKIELGLVLEDIKIICTNLDIPFNL